LEGTTLEKDVWRCAWAIALAPYVMTSGMPLMPVWCADSWASPNTVRVGIVSFSGGCDSALLM